VATYRPENWAEKRRPDETLEFDPRDPEKWWRPRRNPSPPVQRWLLQVAPWAAYCPGLLFLAGGGLEW